MRDRRKFLSSTLFLLVVQHAISCRLVMVPRTPRVIPAPQSVGAVEYFVTLRFVDVLRRLVVGLLLLFFFFLLLLLVLVLRRSVMSTSAALLLALVRRTPHSRRTGALLGLLCGRRASTLPVVVPNVLLSLFFLLRGTFFSVVRGLFLTRGGVCRPHLVRHHPVGDVPLPLAAVQEDHAHPAVLRPGQQLQFRALLQLDLAVLGLVVVERLKPNRVVLGGRTRRTG
mmetsp:Transcript_1993/g.4627  ORF Transcript_1993/g.4627 Transcript_1993/m.4627 type:complete len:226 (-) Transcript_1993:1575-2252(-)